MGRNAPPVMQKLRVIDGKYNVRGTIGSGGMGVVLEAEHTGLSRIVAIKILHPHLAGDEVQTKRFMREARTAGMTGHRNVCTVFDAGFLEDGRPYLVMERLYGQSLANRITDGRPISTDVAVEITCQALSALGAVHRAGVVHRDVKPDNVFLVEQPERPGEVYVKVLDFGTSKPMSGPERDLTGTGIAIGTAYYMSPEQARGERDLDGRVDVYACGVMLYEMLSGQRPFVGSSEHGVLLKILAGSTIPLRTAAPNVSPELEAIVAKAMAREREDRYQSTEELAEALDTLRGQRAAPSTPRDDRPQPPAAPLPASVRVPAARSTPPSEPTIPLASHEAHAISQTLIDQMPGSAPSGETTSARPANTPPSAPPRSAKPTSETAPTRLLSPLDDTSETTRVVPPRGRS